MTIAERVVSRISRAMSYVLRIKPAYRTPCVSIYGPLATSHER